MQSLHDLLNENNATLSKLLKTATLLTALNEAVSKHLPPELANHCVVCNLKMGGLILATDTPARLMRLRYEIPSLLSQLRREPAFAHLATISCHVQTDLHPTYSPRTAPPLTRRPLSANVRAHLQHTADALTDDALRAPFLRLAKRL